VIRLLSLVFLPYLLPAQATIVRSAPSETFDLGCAGCSLTVADLAVLKGQQFIPLDIRLGGITNLLHWRYYDRFLQREATYPQEMLTEPCTQLLEGVADTALLSLHIVLTWTDSSGRSSDVFLLVSGLVKEQLYQAPFQAFFDSDPYLAPRFAAIARITPAQGQAETFDSIEGEVTISEFDPRKRAIAGEVAFEGNCIGWQKLGYFRKGEFQN
jgi:hypothetical protein